MTFLPVTNCSLNGSDSLFGAGKPLCTDADASNSSRSWQTYARRRLPSFWASISVWQPRVTSVRLGSSWAALFKSFNHAKNFEAANQTIGHCEPMTSLVFLAPTDGDSIIIQAFRSTLNKTCTHTQVFASFVEPLKRAPSIAQYLK